MMSTKSASFRKMGFCVMDAAKMPVLGLSAVGTPV